MYGTEYRYGPLHTWFAWHPVRTTYYGWVWLRTVERRRQFRGEQAQNAFLIDEARWVYTLPGADTHTT